MDREIIKDYSNLKAESPYIHITHALHLLGLGDTPIDKAFQYYEEALKDKKNLEKLKDSHLIKSTRMKRKDEYNPKDEENNFQDIKNTGKFDSMLLTYDTLNTKTIKCKDLSPNDLKKNIFPKDYIHILTTRKLLDSYNQIVQSISDNVRYLALIGLSGVGKSYSLAYTVYQFRNTFLSPLENNINVKKIPAYFVFYINNPIHGNDEYLESEFTKAFKEIEEVDFPNPIECFKDDAKIPIEQWLHYFKLNDLNFKVFKEGLNNFFPQTKVIMIWDHININKYSNNTDLTDLYNMLMKCKIFYTRIVSASSNESQINDHIEKFTRILTYEGLNNKELELFIELRISTLSSDLKKQVRIYEKNSKVD